LPDNDPGETFEALGPLAQRRIASQRMNPRQMRADAGERRNALLDVGFASDRTHRQI